jgi:hypothetical protein
MVPASIDSENLSYLMLLEPLLTLLPSIFLQSDGNRDWSKKEEEITENPSAIDHCLLVVEVQQYSLY